jgi:nicotinamide mononucleotide transporter
MSSWEVFGFASGALSVWLYVRQSVWAWPVGLVNSACWLVLFWSSRLYLDGGLQILYIGLGVAGWYWWLRGDARPAGLPVTSPNRREVVALVAAGIAGTLALWGAMVAAGDALPLPDAATTVLSLIAQYMLTRKFLASWWCWIAVDVAYVAIYSSQQLYLTAALQPLFICMCLLGLWRWRASMERARMRPVPPAPATAPLPV